MTKQDQLKSSAHSNVCDAIELKKVASAASLTSGARRIGGVVYRELRDRAAANLREARDFDAAFARRVWNNKQNK